MNRDTVLSTEIENAVGPELADALYECGFIRSIELTYKQLRLLSERRALLKDLMHYVLPALQQAYERGELPDEAQGCLWALRWFNEARNRRSKLYSRLHEFPNSVAKLWVDYKGQLPLNQLVAFVYCPKLEIRQQTEKEMRIALKQFERAIARYLRALGKTRKEQRRTAEELLRQMEGEDPPCPACYEGFTFSHELLVFLLSTRLFGA